MTTFYQHPDYSLYLPDYERYRDLYEGKHDVMVGSQYLWPHEFEIADAFKAAQEAKDGRAPRPSLRAIREQRSRYMNYFKSIIKRYVSLMFRTEPDFETALKLKQIADYLANVDGKQNSLFNFIKKSVAPDFFLYGKSAILCDAPNEYARNKLEEQAKGLRPYMSRINPMELKDWATALLPGIGQGYKFIRHEYELLADRDSAEVAPKKELLSDVYKIGPNGYTIARYVAESDNKGNLKIEDGQKQWRLMDTYQPTAEFSQIPIAIACGESWMHDVAERALLLYNLESSLDNQLNFQAFQKIFALGNFEPGDGVVMTESTVAMIRGAEALQVVEPSNPIALKERINGVAAGLFQLAFHRSRVLPADSKEVEAADNQRESKEEFLACLEDASSQIESQVNRAVSDFAAFAGVKDFDPEIKFTFDATIEDLDQELAMFNALYADIRTHQMWYRETLKKFANKMNLASYDEIAQEIDAAPAPQDLEQQANQSAQDIFAGLVNEAE